MMQSSQSRLKKATVSEMIHRFRTAQPTSSAIREAMRQNLDAPSKMWYEEGVDEEVPTRRCDGNHDEIEGIVEEKVEGRRASMKDFTLTSFSNKFRSGSSCDNEYGTRIATNKNGGYVAGHKWRYRFKNGI